MVNLPIDPILFGKESKKVIDNLYHNKRIPESATKKLWKSSCPENPHTGGGRSNLLTRFSHTLSTKKLQMWKRKTFLTEVNFLLLSTFCWEPWTQHKHQNESYGHYVSNVESHSSVWRTDRYCPHSSTGRTSSQTLIGFVNWTGHIEQHIHQRSCPKTSTSNHPAQLNLVSCVCFIIILTTR